MFTAMIDSRSIAWRGLQMAGEAATIPTVLPEVIEMFALITFFIIGLAASASASDWLTPPVRRCQKME